MFTKLPPSISYPLFYLITGTALVYRFLFSNLWGMLLVCSVIYWLSPSILEVQPYNFQQIILWLSEQSESTQSAILGSFITIIGFLIAYATATANWKSQLLAELKLQAANDIESFFSIAGKLTTDCRLYAESLVEAVDKIQKGCSEEEANFLAAYNREQGEKFLQNRQQLSSMGVEAHRFQGKYTNVLVSAPGVLPSLLNTVNCLNSITEDMWFHVPYFVDSDPDPIQSFINQVNVADCIKFSTTANNNFDQLNFKSGSVRGSLQSSVVPFTLWSFLYLLKERKGFKEALKNNYEFSNKKDG